MTQGPEHELPVSRGALAPLLAAAFFVSPLIFFTNLTRNPYYLQITLLNISILAAAALFIAASIKRGRWLLPVSALSRPLGALGLVYCASFAWSWTGHAAFFHPSMASEGLRAGIFFLVNCLGAFYLSLSVPFAGADEEIPAWKWLAFIFGWGALWFLFPWLRTVPAGDGFFDRFFDPYGALLWVSGFTAVWLLIRRCRQEDILHLALSVGAIASLYGILEYFRVELVWAKLMNPYGNRSVSTFGNPNFISSYVVLFLPLAVSMLMKAGTRVQRAYYGLVCLAYGGMLLSSLTRSSWIGAASALAFMFAFASHRRMLRVNRRFLAPFFAVTLALLVLWPADSLKPFSSGMADRISEASSGIRSPSAMTLSGDEGRVYASFHQRLLMWTGAWQMGLENPLLGNGWGLFELFYPFYQGRILVNFPVIRNLRTHANNAHNEALEQFSQAGILGLGIYIWFLAALFFGFLRFYKAAGPEARYEAVPLAAGIFGMLADNMLNVSLHFSVPALAFWWMAGALARKTAGVSPRPRWKFPAASRAAAFALLALCLCGGLFWQRQFMREFHYFNGFRAMRTNNFPVAAAELMEAWKSNPREVNSNYEMGNAFVRSGDAEKGAWAYSEALKSNAGYDEIYFNRAIILTRLGRTREALDYLKVSSFINPLNAPVWQALAKAYMALPDKEKYGGEAAADFTEAASVFSHDGNMWNTLGYFRVLNKDYQGAREAYGRGVKVEPENMMLAENLAGVSRQLRLSRDPDLEWLAEYRRLTAALAAPAPRPGDLSAADALLGMDPGNPKARVLRAKLLFKAGRFSEARADMSAALKENYFDNSARYGLAVLYEKEGNFPMARAEWGRFLELEPANASVAARLRALPQ